MNDTSPRLVVFDCDGTLVDSQFGILNAMRAAWAAHGLDNAPDIAAVRRIVGLPLLEAISRLHPAGAATDHDALVGFYKDAFFQQRQDPSHEEPLFPGTRAVLEALHQQGFLLAVATGKSRRGLVATLDRHGLLGLFTVLKTADDGPGKPNPDILVDAMTELGVAPQDTVMIGDTVFDILMARQAGAYALGVDWGYHDPAELHAAGAHASIAAFGELIPWLNALWRGGNA